MLGALSSVIRRKGAKITKAPYSANEAHLTATTGKMTSQALVESASAWSEIAVVTFGTLAAIAGVFAWYFSEKSGEYKDAAIAKFQTESKVAIAAAETRGAEANDKAAQAIVKAAALEKDAALARLELQKIKDIQQPRQITKKDREIIIGCLDKTEGEVRLVRVGASEECYSFTYQLAEALKHSHLRVNVFDDALSRDPVFEGMWIGFAERNNAPLHAEEVRLAFAIAGIWGYYGMEVRSELALVDPEGQGPQPGVVYIYIGEKEVSKMDQHGSPKIRSAFPDAKIVWWNPNRAR